MLVPLNGGPWIPVGSNDSNNILVKSEVQKPIPDSSLLYSSLRGGSLSETEVRDILSRNSINEIKKWNSYGHPIFHEAAEQSAKTSEFVWTIVSENPEFIKLVNDPEYTDKYGCTAFERLEVKKHRITWKSEIYEKLLPHKPVYGLMKCHRQNPVLKDRYGY